MKEFTVPTPVSSASLHPDKSIFVCGGEDLKMYKFNYSTGVEIGKSCIVICVFFNSGLSLSNLLTMVMNYLAESFKGHFGPVHCVRFSPDGELYASGSEDGTLRLWQTTVGKTYGLWKCVEASIVNPTETATPPAPTIQEVPAN